MKKYFFIFALCGLLFSCGEGSERPEPEPPQVEEPEEPEEPEEQDLPCGCACVEEPIPEYSWKKELLVWDYPAKLCTEEWAQFSAFQEMIDACLIPEDVLSLLSTEELLDVCLQYPLLFLDMKNEKPVTVVKAESLLA